VAARPKLWPRLVDLWGSRELFVFLVRKEIKVKYKNSVLGFMWSMLNPALNLAVYFLVFQEVLKNGIPSFVIYLFSGLLAWNLFQTGVQTATGTVVNNSGLVKKVAFPREILALASVGSAFMFFVFQCTVMLGFMLVLLHPPAWQMLWLLPLALLTLVMFSAALAVFFSAVNVYMRDTQHLIEVLMTAWFWAGPVVYSYAEEIGPKLATHWIGLKIIYFSNPLTPVILAFQRVLYRSGNIFVGNGPLRGYQTFVQVTEVPKKVAGHVVMVHGHVQEIVDKTIGHLVPVLPNYPASWYLWTNLLVLAISITLFLLAMVVFGRLEGNFAEEL
jgi:ABC-2 type transport system permease protein